MVLGICRSKILFSLWSNHESFSWFNWAAVRSLKYFWSCCCIFKVLTSCPWSSLLRTLTWITSFKRIFHNCQLNGNWYSIYPFSTTWAEVFGWKKVTSALESFFLKLLKCFVLFLRLQYHCNLFSSHSSLQTSTLLEIRSLFFSPIVIVWKLLIWKIWLHECPCCVISEHRIIAIN